MKRVTGSQCLSFGLRAPWLPAMNLIAYAGRQDVRCLTENAASHYMAVPPLTGMRVPACTELSHMTRAKLDTPRPTLLYHTYTHFPFSAHLRLRATGGGHSERDAPPPSSQVDYGSYIVASWGSIEAGPRSNGRPGGPFAKLAAALEGQGDDGVPRCQRAGMLV